MKVKSKLIFAKVLTKMRNGTQDIISIVHFTVVCLVTLPLSGSEAGGDLSAFHVNNAFLMPNSLFYN